MPHYQIRLTKKVTDILEANFEVEADSEEEAKAEAMDADKAGTLDWQLHIADIDPEDAEVDDVRQIFRADD